ncbi:hypothetical protein [Thalassobius sp. Cn5-15]|uniref:hypothetical protein n=1 Tax=Thalassobius sp. Cn5-15 TaxID=2917763 RepID=UPI001EF1C362|nr:hypothetical protein [Thalassobius sp. Cn5-15]MCG7492432.1 hypothetical protein [Thalassobius sp. Cn5-15]
MINATVYTFATDCNDGTNSVTFGTESEAEEYAWEWCAERADLCRMCVDLDLKFDPEDPTEALANSDVSWGDIWEYNTEMLATCSMESHVIRIPLPHPDIGAFNSMEALASALKDGIGSDIWYDADDYKDFNAAAQITKTQNAMAAAANLVSEMFGTRAPLHNIRDEAVQLVRQIATGQFDPATITDTASDIVHRLEGGK